MEFNNKVVIVTGGARALERPLQRNCLYEKSINIMTTPKRKEEVIMYKKLMTCLESVRKKIDFKPEVALILGSGLGDFADGIQIEQTIDYTDIEDFRFLL